MIYTGATGSPVEWGIHRRNVSSTLTASTVSTAPAA